MTKLAKKPAAKKPPPEAQPKPGDLRVWWIPQVPGKPFQVPVKTLDEARLLLDTLAKYDFFQLENNIKGDYCNTGGLEEFDRENLEWCEWYDDDGNDVMGRP